MALKKKKKTRNVNVYFTRNDKFFSLMKNEIKIG